MALSAIRILRFQSRILCATSFVRNRVEYCKTLLAIAGCSTRISQSSFSSKPIWHSKDKTVKKMENSEIFPSVKDLIGLDERVKSAKSVKELLQIYRTLKSDLTPTDAVRLLFRMARVSLRSRDGYRRDRYTMKNLEFLLADIKHCSAGYSHRQLADIIWSTSKLGIGEKSGHFGHYEREIICRDLSLFSNIDLAMILWGYGKMHAKAPHLYTVIRKELMSRGLSCFSLYELCQVVWSFVRNMEQSAKLFAQIKDEVMKRGNLKELNRKGLVMLLWSYAESGVNVFSLFQVLKKEILQRGVSTFNQEQLSQIVWSFANQNMKAPELFNEIEKTITSRDDLLLDKQGLVMISWAFAKTDNPSERIFQHIEQKLMSMELQGFTAPQHVRLLWAFTKSGKLKKRVLVRLSEAILLQDFAQFTEGPLEELVYSLKNCPFAVPELVAATEAELMRRSKS